MPPSGAPGDGDGVIGVTRSRRVALGGGRRRRGLMRAPRSAYLRAQRRRTTLRAGLTVLALAAAVTGLWALLFPLTFFSDFPVPAWGWVRSLPPYNEHLVRDVGSFYVAYAGITGWAAVRLDTVLCRSVLVAWIAMTVPHLVVHVFVEKGGLRGPGEVPELVVLVLAVTLPLVLLFRTGGRGRLSGGG